MSDKINILDYETVELDTDTNELVIIDQTKLPGNIEIIRLKSAQEIWDAIYLLKVRGAPAIGVAAAFGLYILATQIKADSFEGFYKEFVKNKEFLNSSRPTAVNLSWALNRMDKLACTMKEFSIDEILEAL
jgi:methylthioribose-1-phosphate isomerase (EC 5.3.1.23)